MESDFNSKLDDATLLTGLGLAADKQYDEMSSLSPSSKEWCDLAEKFISVTRYIIELENKIESVEN